MALDFSKIGTPSTADTLINPREIFSALPGKDKKFSGYLRDVQAEVLNQWFERRESADLRLKMNTGGGKTVVGLLILKSCLNESKIPAVYVAPTAYLASQVIVEAKALGLSVEEDPRATAVSRGKSILVTNIKVLLNGKSKFGVGDAGKQIPIGSLVLDDAHACLSTAEQMFTAILDAKHPSYDALFKLFREDLEGQSSTGVLDVEQHEPYKYMLVPYWAWLDKIKNVEAELHPHREDEELKFVWPLLQNHLRLCRCVFGGGRVEISPRCLPVEMIPSFAGATRRIFMSATFADDAVLVTDFDAKADDIATAIAPGSASDIGDRMILVPQELDPNITDEEIKKLAVRKAKKHNVVVIVPSNYRARFWADSAALTLNAENLEEGVARLQKEHVGLTVVINKYDGIDLPYDACRVLILDGCPDVRRAIDRIQQSHLAGTELELAKSIQQIEQGMGRGVRASDDYCVVLLMGRSLTGNLFTTGGLSRLTAATLAQFQLSEKIGEQIRNKGINEIEKTIEYCLSRNPDWVKAAKSALVHVKYATSSSDLKVAIARRQAFSHASHGDAAAASHDLQDIVNRAEDKVIKGCLMAEMAEYTHEVDAVESQQILKSAHALNRQLIRPLSGIDYLRISPLHAEQATAAIQHYRVRFKRANDLVVAAHALADDLAFRPDSFKKFHRAMHGVALLLGFESQLPEAEYGKGPDVLWAVGNLKYFIIECKNEATTETVNKKDTNQLAGSVNWFKERYDKTCSGTPVMVHPSNVFEHAATPPAQTRVMTTDGLARFKENFTAFIVAASRLTKFGEPKEIANLLTAHKLLPDMLLNSYTALPKSK